MTPRTLSTLLLVAACSGGAPQRRVEPPPSAPEPFTTSTRPADGEDEAALRDYLFDPALDCVAEKLGGTLDAAAYRGALPIDCGSPLHPIDARITKPGELAATVEDMAKRFHEPVPKALGIARRDGALTVVIAGRAVELDPFRSGDRQIRGRLLIQVSSLLAFVSSATGVVQRDVVRDGDRFSLQAPAGDADVELVISVGTETGPLGRVRVGRGSPLFAKQAPLADRVAAARAALGLSPLAAVALAGPCTPVPAQVAGIDVTDRSSCYTVPFLQPRDLGEEAAYNPLMQAKLLAPDAAALEIGFVDKDAAFRVTRRFEVLTPDAGRARVLARLRETWPKLVEQPAPPGALSNLLDAWAASGQPDETSAQFQPRLMEVAAHWSTQPHFLVVLSTARDLDAAIARITSDTVPAAVDVGFAQVRDKRGEMRHLIAVVLATP